MTLITIIGGAIAIACLGVCCGVFIGTLFEGRHEEDTNLGPDDYRALKGDEES